MNKDKSKPHGVSTPSTDAEDVSIEPQNIVSVGEADIGAILEAIEKRDGDGMIVLSESKLENLAAHCRQQAERIAELEAVRAHYADENNWAFEGGDDMQPGFTEEQHIYTPNGNGYEVAQKAAKEGECATKK